MTVRAVIASSVTGGGETLIGYSPEKLEIVYRAIFWTCFTSIAIVALTSIVGLERAGKVGLKRE